MEIYNINCIDKIGLSIDGIFNQVKFKIYDEYSNDKIKILCVNKINEIYNPKYPYFFIKINDIIKNIDCNIVRNRDNYNVELVANDSIYKLKFFGLCDNPVYCLCSNTIYFSNIIKMLNIKYPICHSGIFIHSDIQLKSNMKTNHCNFKSDIINEIYCTPGNHSNYNFCM